MNIDLHLHTVVSDGTMYPEELLRTAARLELKTISITDHDSVGAFLPPFSGMIAMAGELGITLLTGMELDSIYQDQEIHILGYGINVRDPRLTAHLTEVQSLRRKKTMEQFTEICRLFPHVSFPEKELWITERQTMMKPHLVHLLLRKGLFDEYRKAAQWISRHVSVVTRVPKFPTSEMIHLIKQAGGTTVLAHPGYYEVEKGIDLERMIRDLLPVGLDGLEIIYPYMGTSPAFPDRESEEAAHRRLLVLAEEYGLLGTIGSDAHSITQMEEFTLHPRSLIAATASIDWFQVFSPPSRTFS